MTDMNSTPELARNFRWSPAKQKLYTVDSDGQVWIVAAVSGVGSLPSDAVRLAPQDGDALTLRPGDVVEVAIGCTCDDCPPCNARRVSELEGCVDAALDIADTYSGHFEIDRIIAALKGEDQ